MLGALAPVSSVGQAAALGQQPSPNNVAWEGRGGSVAGGGGRKEKMPARVEGGKRCNLGGMGGQGFGVG